MKYFIDEFRSTLIAIAARGFGVDVTSSHESDRDGLSDRDQLLRAASEGRCLVTQNHKDFRPLSEEFQVAGLSQAGILLVRRGPVTRHHTGAVVAALAAHAARNPDGMPPYMIDFLRF